MSHHMPPEERFGVIFVLIVTLSLIVWGAYTRWDRCREHDEAYYYTWHANLEQGECR